MRRQRQVFSPIVTVLFTFLPAAVAADMGIDGRILAFLSAMDKGYALPDSNWYLQKDIHYINETIYPPYYARGDFNTDGEPDFALSVLQFDPLGRIHGRILVFHFKSGEIDSCFPLGDFEVFSSKNANGITIEILGSIRRLDPEKYKKHLAQADTIVEIKSDAIELRTHSRYYWAWDGKGYIQDYLFHE